MHQQQQEQHQSPIINPSHAQVDGQNIYLGGLDYGLLEQEKNKQVRKIVIDMNDIKSKLSLYSDRLTKNKQVEDNYQSDPFITNLIRVIQQKHTHSKPTVGTNTFYLFDTKCHFGLIQPTIITRKFLKTQQPPSIVHNTPQIINQLINLINQTHQSSNQQSQNIQNQDDSDEQSYYLSYIFNDNNQANNKIEVGRKLDFGIKDDDLFGKFNKDILKKPMFDLQQEKQDKYQFLRKKVKPSLQNYDDGYGQCYAETGPSLDEMKQLKKLGIQLFQDAKQFKPKEKKINIGKDYQKIKKIIQEKNKK